MHIRTRLDINNLAKYDINDNVVYRIYFITEGYEECKANLTMRSIPLFIVQSPIEITPCVLRGLKRISYQLYNSKDINLTCQGADNKIDREINEAIFHNQVKEFHNRHCEFVHRRIDDLLQVIDIGSSLAITENKAKKMRMGRN